MPGVAFQHLRYRSARRHRTPASSNHRARTPAARRPVRSWAASCPHAPAELPCSLRAHAPSQPARALPAPDVTARSARRAAEAAGCLVAAPHADALTGSSQLRHASRRARAPVSTSSRRHSNHSRVSSAARRTATSGCSRQVDWSAGRQQSAGRQHLLSSGVRCSRASRSCTAHAPGV